ncbi:MAG: Smr/MutS family protein [Rhodospirillaceae bacterium]|nr:Smr/MutS family protein [Rhodospirillaceae bacterium]
MTRSRRDLSLDDLKIWRHVARSVNPLPGFRHPTPEDEDMAEEPRREKVSEAPFLETPQRAPVRPAPPLALGATADMDRRTARRFQRGDMAVNGRIDLHGLTLDQAHGALTAFIRGAHARGARCVVVVTGKGKGGSIGKIRNETPYWLNQAPLRPLILAVSEARHRDGGAGALYVLLKRKR